MLKNVPLQHIFNQQWDVANATSRDFNNLTKTFEALSESNCLLKIDKLGWCTWSYSNAVQRIVKLSEEPAEARKKHLNLRRLNQGRKFLWKVCNLDVLHGYFLDFISLLPVYKKRKIQECFQKKALKNFCPQDKKFFFNSLIEIPQ